MDIYQLFIFPLHIKENIMNYYHPYHTLWNNVMNSLLIFHRKKEISYLWYKLMNDLSYYHKDKSIKNILDKDKDDKKWNEMIIKDIPLFFF
jgi:hypothetical protein